VQVTDAPAAGAEGALGQALQEQLDAIAVDSSGRLRNRRPTAGMRAVVAWLAHQLSLLPGKEARPLRQQLGARVYERHAPRGGERVAPEDEEPGRTLRKDSKGAPRDGCYTDEHEDDQPQQVVAFLSP
jgi:hypothetical protein